MNRTLLLACAVVGVSVAACQSQQTSSMSTEGIPSLEQRPYQASAALSHSTERISDDQVTISQPATLASIDRASAPAVMPHQLQDVYFEYDSARVTEKGQQTLQEIAQWLRASGSHTKATIEGHCDVRGTLEYNLVLGERRAGAAKQYLHDLGIAPERLSVLSYGQSRPACNQPEESCYRLNRRAHILLEPDTIATHH